MTKHLLTLAAGLCLYASAHAQKNYYNLETAKATYAPLEGGIKVDKLLDDTSTVLLNLDATFRIFGEDYKFDAKNPMQLDRGGFITGTNLNHRFALDAWGTKGVKRLDTSSHVVYTFEGTPGSRWLKIEFQNCGLIDGPATDFINYQFWLNEKGQSRVWFGNKTISSMDNYLDGTMGCMLGMFLAQKDNSGFIDQIWVTGNSDVPNVNRNMFGTVNGTPSKNSRYDFVSAVSGVEENTLADGATINLYPSPASTQITLSGELKQVGPVTLTVSDMSGRMVRKIEMGQQPAGVLSKVIDLDGLEAGAYVIQLNANNTSWTGKFMKN